MVRVRIRFSAWLCKSSLIVILKRSVTIPAISPPKNYSDICTAEIITARVHRCNKRLQRLLKMIRLLFCQRLLSQQKSHRVEK